jgi:hypothetical protein
VIAVVTLPWSQSESSSRRRCCVVEANTVVHINKHRTPGIVRTTYRIGPAQCKLSRVVVYGHRGTLGRTRESSAVLWRGTRMPSRQPRDHTRLCGAPRPKRSVVSPIAVIHRGRDVTHSRLEKRLKMSTSWLLSHRCRRRHYRIAVVVAVVMGRAMSSWRRRTC